ncbi:MAG: pectinesterase family protein [Eubacterium sp.]|nr:pectinesterase family protein [Eubacterium sp.]
MQSEKRNVFSRFISVILSVIMAVSCLCVPVFAETTTNGDWTIDDDTAVYGDIGFTYHKNNTTDTWTYASSGGKYYVRPSSTNGYASNAGIINTAGYAYCDFTPAKDGTLVVYIGNASTKTGYVNKKADDGDMTLIGSFVPGGTDDYDTTGLTVTQGSTWATLEIEVETGYTYYIALSGSKMLCYGAEFTAYTNVTGTVTDSFGLSSYGIKFTNKTTGETKEAEVSEGTYSVLLKPGYDYSAALTGENANSYAFTSGTRTVTVSVQDTQTADLTIEERVSYTVSGSITGMTGSYSLSDMKLTFTPEDTSSFETVNAAIDTTNKTYSVQLAALENYTLSLSGAYDYEISSSTSYYGSDGTAQSVDITLSAVSTYAVSGGFLGLTQTRGEYTNLSVTPSAITFTNVDDGYTYSGTASEGAYSVSLRNGSYLASITADGYSTSTHVVVNGAAVSRDLLLKAETTESVEYADTLYVGSGRTYTTIQSAIDAVTNMGTRTSEQPVTIEIDPGTYREQVVINTPYVTLKGTGTSRDKTVITWYYGIGYNYYSCSNGYYDPYADYDKFAKSEPARWGAAVLTQSSATGFKAENITFENSFNKYMTDEELSDGVEISGSSSISVVRKETTNVDDRASTERAAAYVNYADQTEFYNCSFIGSQDTLYTCNRAYDAYYRSCYIEGQTDFIYGDGNVIFDGCEINFCGYDGTKASGYITAQSASDSSNTEYGYIFRSCYVSYNSKRDTTAGSFGRMWGNRAMVTFLDTQLQESDIILAEGWTDMTVKATAETVRLMEYNTTYNGTQVDTSGRVNGVVDSIDRDAYSVESVFIANGWTPSYYVADSTTTPSFATAPTLSSNGDLNKPNPGETVTVSYELDQNGDASRISWYGVEYTPTYDDENVSSITTESLDTLLSTATLLYTSSAVSTNSYQIPMDCAGLYLLAVVTPITNYGLVGDPEFVVVSGDAVSSTWNDPSNPGSIAPGSGINIYLAGDSTVKDYSAKGMYNNGSILSAGSWGEFLQEFFDDDYVQVNDYAQGGRACRSFLNEGKLDAIMENIKAGDYLLMQFGHNDSASGEDYYIDRFVPLYTQDELPEDTENRSYGFPTIKPEESMKTASPSSLVGSYGDTYYAWDCGATYKGFLQEYIDEALAVGAIPVIVSPVARMYYNSDGSIRTHHDAGTSFDTTKDYYTTNNAYVTACEELYEENKDKGVLYIDGYEMTEKLYTDAWAERGSNEYGAAIMDVTSEGSIDSTHSNKTGGMIQAGLIAKWMQDADISLSDYVQQPVTVYGEETSGSYIFTIIDKIFTAKDKNLVEYEYWSNLGQELFDSIGGSSSVVYIDLDFSTEDAVALYETNADTTFTDGVYSGKYTNDSSQTFNVSVYQDGVSYSESRASFGTKVTSSPVFSFTVSDAASYTVTFTPSTSYGESDIVGLYTDSSCTEAAATALVSEGSVTYNKTASGEETLYFSTDSSNLYVTVFTISSEDLPVNEVSLNFATEDARAFYTDSSSYTDGVYSGEYTNSSGQTFDVSVYQSSIAYHTYDYGTKVTANKPIFSFTVSEPGYYTVDYVLSSAASATTVGLYKDSSCATEAASAALADGSVTYTKTTSGEETLYFGSVDATNLYIKSFDISSEDLTVVSLTFNTADDYAAYVTNADTTFDDNDYYTGLYTNSDGQSFEVSIIESGIKYLSDGRYNYGTFLTVKKPIFCITLDEKAMYTITTTGTCNSTSTLNLYTESGCENSVASGDAPGSVIYKKTTDTAETLYVAASVSNNLYVQTFTVTKEELADETTQVYKGSVTGIETDDSNVQLTFKSSTDTVEVSAEEYSSTGATLIDNDTYTVTAVGDKGVYTGSVTTDGSGTADITLSRIEFDFPLDFVNNFDDYSTYTSAKGSSSADVTDPYSGITIHRDGIVLTETLRSYGAKTNNNSIISFEAKATGKVTVNVGGCVTDKDDTLQLLVNGEAGTDAVSASGNISLTADVTAGDTVTLYTPTRVNLYYKTIDVEYDAKAIKTIGGSRYIIFGISEEEAQNSSNFNVIQNNVSAVDSEGKEVDFDTVYEAVQFGETIMKAEEILGEGVKYVIAFMLSDDDANTSDTEILDGFDLDFN